ncbi:MAG TPA: hypothetical protein VGR80_06200 [Steroidobacteraceae bacterium]|nr:hypothetical protein [Steroidobacteraceae bacterium]
MRFLFVSLVIVATLGACAEEPTIGYPTVDSALEALHRDAHAKFTIEDGWTIATTEESGKPVIWSFAPKGHPAYPVAVKRTIFENGSAVFIDMKALCSGPQVACAKLVGEFKDANERLIQNLSWAREF